MSLSLSGSAPNDTSRARPESPTADKLSNVYSSALTSDKTEVFDKLIIESLTV